MESVSEIDDRINGIDAIIHQAAIPAPGLETNHKTFRMNTLSTYNIFQVAKVLKINNIVWASSETVLGLPFDTYPPYVPVDEEYYPRPESSYSLSKVMGEEMARQYCRRNPEMKIFGLRYSNIMEEHDYLGDLVEIVVGNCVGCLLGDRDLDLILNGFFVGDKVGICVGCLLGF